jgi:ferredoxin
MRYQVTIDNTGETFRCDDEVNVLAAMEQACCHGIPVGCRNGGCGACKVRITSGSFHTRKMNRAVVSAAEESDGCVLACKTYPRSGPCVADGQASPEDGVQFRVHLDDDDLSTRQGDMKWR